MQAYTGISVGGFVCPLDQGLFIFLDSNKNIYGIIVCFVDDMIYGGTNNLQDTIIGHLKTTFEISSEHHQAFTYIGINIKQKKDKSITVDQETYINQISQMKSLDQNSEEPLKTKEENTEFRGLVGQLNWAFGITRPEIGFEVCHASTKMTNPTSSDAHRINKVVKQLRDNHNYILFPTMKATELRLEIYTDASYNNLPKGGSQGGHLVFLRDNNNSCLIAWKFAG